MSSGDEALSTWALVDDLAGGANDALSLAHAARARIRAPRARQLGRVPGRRRKAATSAWQHGMAIAASISTRAGRSVRAAHPAQLRMGRPRQVPVSAPSMRSAPAGPRAWPGLAREAELFAKPWSIPKAARPASPVHGQDRARRCRCGATACHRSRAFACQGHQQLEAAGELLPVGAPFFPGVTPIPGPSIWLWHRRATRIPARRASASRETHERELIVPVDAATGTQ
jgi:acrylyl-CoA reductase (NADPH) / 3-hydroxypropionyl-CoA dehydratase / 3-hydroxypropionyl-CoA synthetase